MKIRKWSASVFAIALLTGALVAVAPSTAQAQTSCVGYKSNGVKTVGFSAFAGHQVRATLGYWCFLQRTTYVGPPNGIRELATPNISFPSRFPASLGEQVHLIQPPYLIRASTGEWSYRFTVEQGISWIPWTQTFDFDVNLYGNGQARICFVGGSCSTFQ
jgi:hypothetical protein